MCEPQDPGQDDQPEYQPTLYGFPFMNKYRFGLCGGMSFGSCDYFYARKPIPSPPNSEQSEQISRNLWFFFARRQAASLRYPVFMKFFLSMVNQKYRQNETDKSFQFLKNNLNPKTPVNLCLIRTRNLFKTTENHQVLAYKLCELPENLFEIHTYDPDEPRDSGMLIYITLQNNKVVKLSQDIDYDQDNSPLLGFFVNERYSQKTDLPEIII